MRTLEVPIPFMAPPLSWLHPLFIPRECPSPQASSPTRPWDDLNTNPLLCVTVDSVAVEEQERERRRQVVEKFQKAPFEEIAAHCGARVSGTPQGAFRPIRNQIWVEGRTELKPWLFVLRRLGVWFEHTECCCLPRTFSYIASPEPTD